MKNKGQKQITATLRTRTAEAAAIFKNRLDLGGEALILPSARTEKKVDTKVLASGIASVVISFILAGGKMAFGTYPLGIALVCAATSQAPILALGASLGTLAGESSPVYILSYIIALIFRFSLAFYLSGRGKKGILSRAAAAWGSAFCESLYLRMAISIVPAFVSGAYLLASGGFAYRDILGMLFLMICTPAAVFVYSGAFDDGVRATPFFAAAVAALLFSAVFSLRSATLLGISLGLVAAFFITLYTAREGGVVRAAVVGILVGLAISPVYAPLVALTGIVAAALSGVSVQIASAAGTVFAVALGFFTLGMSSFTSLLPASAIGALIFSITDTAGVLPGLDIIKKDRQGVSAKTLAEKKSSSLVSDIEEISEAFSSLSEIFLNLSEHTRVPSLPEFKQICDAACDKYCAKCEKSGLCWGREYGSLSDMVAKLAGELRSCGRVSSKHVPEHIRERCPSLGGILDEINRSAAREIESALRTDRTETVSLDYAAFSVILADALDKNKNEYALDAELSERLQSAFEARNKDFPCKGVTVWGERVKHIVVSGVGAVPLAKSAPELKKALEDICAMKISEPRLEISEGGVSISFEAMPRFCVETSHATASAGGEECGDSVVMFDGRRDYFYSMINDGMGSGRVAALTSQICAVFMEKLLSCGLGAEPSLKILSSVLRAKSIECSSSVDLAEFDLVHGRVCFIKSGAAPSFVRRAGKLFRLSSKTLPIGILRTFDAEQIKFELEAGDVIIMLSDGVCEDFDECAWLPTLLTEGWDDNIETMADKIIRESTLGNRIRDDISVGIIRVKSA